MREIEFRAWHKKYEYMARVADISFNRKRINLNAADIGSFDDIELMQYTGIKDKNGVKIFEDDIVKCKIGNVDFKGYVYYYGGRFEFIDFEDDEETEFLCYCDELEVIGNIYENPELLGVKNES